MFNILAPIASAALGFLGQQTANSTNRSIANAQMDFQDASQDKQMDYGREMTARQEDFQRGSMLNQEAFQRGSQINQENFQRETLNSAMAYNTQMSNTSYQRGMADMKAAGLNPMLAFGQGGATAPTIGGASGAGVSGTSASGATASASAMPGASTRVESALGPALQSAFQGSRILTELEQLTANVNQTKAATALTTAQQDQVRVNTALQGAQAITEGIRPDLIRAQTRTEEGRPALLGAQTAQQRASARSLHSNADSTDQEVRRFQDYGPRGTIPDGLASGEAIVRRGGNSVVGGQAMDSIMDAIRGLRRWLD